MSQCELFIAQSNYSFVLVNNFFHSWGGVGLVRAGLRFTATCSLRPIPIKEVVRPGAEREN